MIFSANNLFSNAQAITATAVSTNVIDLGDHGKVAYSNAKLKRDWGKGKKPMLNVQVVTDFATLTSLTVTLQHSDDNSTFVDILSSPAIPVASLKAGYQFAIDDLPIGVTRRYIRLNYTVAGSNATAGAVTAGITLGNQQAPL